MADRCIGDGPHQWQSMVGEPAAPRRRPGVRPMRAFDPALLFLLCGASVALSRKAGRTRLAAVHARVLGPHSSEEERSGLAVPSRLLGAGRLAGFAAGVAA